MSVRQDLLTKLPNQLTDPSKVYLLEQITNNFSTDFRYLLNNSLMNEESVVTANTDWDSLELDSYALVQSWSGHNAPQLNGYGVVFVFGSAPENMTEIAVSGSEIATRFANGSWSIVGGDPKELANKINTTVHNAIAQYDLVGLENNSRQASVVAGNATKTANSAADLAHNVQNADNALSNSTSSNAVANSEAHNAILNQIAANGALIYNSLSGSNSSVSAQALAYANSLSANDTNNSNATNSLSANTNNSVASLNTKTDSEANNIAALNNENHSGDNVNAQLESSIKANSNGISLQSSATASMSTVVAYVSQSDNANYLANSKNQDIILNQAAMTNVNANSGINSNASDIADLSNRVNANSTAINSANNNLGASLGQLANSVASASNAVKNAGNNAQVQQLSTSTSSNAKAINATLNELGAQNAVTSSNVDSMDSHVNDAYNTATQASNNATASAETNAKAMDTKFNALLVAFNQVATESAIRGKRIDQLESQLAH